ncbi:MAG: (d)CMP kinase [Myxococcales bacterium]
MKRVIVAIDGPAGAGKSTVSKGVAERLGLSLVDTGAIYRCVALAAIRAGLPLDSDADLERLLDTLDIGFRVENGRNRVLLNGEDVSDAIRTPEISRGASIVSARPVVRAGLLELQRRLARSAPGGAVMEGRDIGTVVFPDADVKFFLTASDEVRARRRHAELTARGVQISLEQVLEDQRQRDLQDTTRDLAPLVAAPDAHHLDASALGPDEVIHRIVELVERLRR